MDSLSLESVGSERYAPSPVERNTRKLQIEFYAEVFRFSLDLQLGNHLGEIENGLVWCHVFKAPSTMYWHVAIFTELPSPCE